VAIAVASMVVLAAIAVAITPVREAVTAAVSGDTESVRKDLRDSAAGVALVLALAMIHVVVWYPAEILDAAAGYVYGFGVALPLVMAGWVASGALAFYVGRHVARPLLYRLAGEERFVRAENLINRGGVTVLLAARLVPIVPFSLMSMVAGAARVPIFSFLWTTAVGYLPITAYFIYLGSQLEGFSIEDPILWIGAAGLLIALFGIRFLMPRRFGDEAG
jgi:uncharacterized membrane protein YdjX (TVP38/TMEM64 family)